MKTEKLTLKHLAPYLPYELKIITKKHLLKYGETHQLIMNGLSIDIKGNLDIEMCKSKTDTELWFKNEFKDGCFKPILRPLSDLRTLGNENIPINEHIINLFIEENFNEDYGMFSCYKNKIEFIKEGDRNTGYDSTKTIDFKLFESVRELLLKAHYDIFGLIEKGLAIDINTL